MRILFALTAVALVGATPALAAKPKPKPKPKPAKVTTYDCGTLMPAAAWDTLMGTTDTLGTHTVTSGVGSYCTYGNAKLVILGGKTAAADWKAWLKATSRPGNQVTQLSGIGAQASEMSHSVVVLTAGGNYIQVLAPSAADYTGLEAVAKAVAAKVK